MRTAMLGWLGWAVLLAAEFGDGTCCAEDLQYHWRAGDEFAYTFEIEADLGDHHQLIKGTNIVRVGPAPDERPSQGGGGGTGTAFVVRADGYLVTCAHVVHGATSVTVQWNGQTLPAKVLATDYACDLALIHIEQNGLPVLPLADSEQVQLAEEVRVVGYPLASMLGNSVKVTTGTIAGTVQNRSHNLFQIDAPINPGNSGGPVIDQHGAVVGVASAKLVGPTYSNVGFAIPSADVKRLLSRNQISGEDAHRGESFSGTELARRVTPSVLLVVVKRGPDSLSGQRFALACRGTCESWQRSKQDTRKPATPGEKRDTGTATVVADTRGQVGSTTNVCLLPFCLGFQGLVGIERLGEAGQDTWHDERMTVVQSSQHHVDFPGAPSPKRSTPDIPVVERSDYRLIETAADGTVTIKKNYELRSVSRSHQQPFIQLSGAGTLVFESRTGLVRGLRFSGTVDVNTRSEPLHIPLKYSYNRVDLATLAADSDGSARRAAEGTFALHVGKLPAGRTPLPGIAEQRKAAAIVEEIFGEPIAAAKSSAQKLALVGQIMQAAMEESKPAERYVLLNRARTLAIAAGETRSALRIASEIVSSYQIDPLPALAATFLAAAKLAATPAQLAQVTQYGEQLAGEAVAAHQFDQANELMETTVQAARQVSDAPTIKELVRHARQVHKVAEAFADLKQQRAALEKDPQDPQANLALGRYYCIVEQNWEAGLPLLARGSDPALKTAAQQDLAAPVKPDARAQVGDLWWQLAEQNEDDAQAALRARALKWYRLAAAELSGLARARTEKRLAQYPDAVAAEKVEKTETSSAVVPRAPVSLHGGEHRLIEHVAGRVKGKQLLPSQIVGFTLKKTPFSVVPPDGALLTGFDLSLGTFNKVVAVRPIFQTLKGQMLGPVIGRPTPSSTRVLARRGYAVGSVTVSGSVFVSGLSMTFMKIGEAGLDAAGSYDSPWYGKHGQDVQLGGNGLPIVGIAGSKDDDLSALGVVLVEKPGP